MANKWMQDCPAGARTIRKRWSVTHPEYYKYWHLKKNYGLTREAYEKLLKDSDYRCAICTDDTDLVVDHDHNTKKVRGILCRSCNLSIGYARDSKAILRNAISYLERIF